MSVSLSASSVACMHGDCVDDGKEKEHGDVGDGVLMYACGVGAAWHLERAHVVIGGALQNLA